MWRTKRRPTNCVNRDGAAPRVRRQEQMHMIGHKHIGMHRTAITINRPSQALMINTAVGLRKKHRLPISPTAGTGSACHV